MEGRELNVSTPQGNTQGFSLGEWEIFYIVSLLWYFVCTLLVSVLALETLQQVIPHSSTSGATCRLAFSDTLCVIFGQHSHIDFHWFGTFCIEKSDHRLHLLLGAQLHQSCHLQQLIITASTTRWLYVLQHSYWWTSTSYITLSQAVSYFEFYTHAVFCSFHWMSFVHKRGERENIFHSDKYLVGYIQDGCRNMFKSLCKLAISIV